MRYPTAMLLGPLALLSCGDAFAANRTASPRPNIVLILADDVGTEVLGCYGGTSYQTPQLDQLSRRGIRFTHGYSMPVCHPTRVCLLTGRYPFRLGNPAWGSFPRGAERQTLAQVVKAAGYVTAVAGKWQLGLLREDLQQPHRMGFDEYCLFGWHEGPRYYDPLIWQNGRRREETKGRYGPDLYCEFLIDFITRNRARPWLVFYSMALCHDVTDDLDSPVPYGPKGRYDNYKEMVEAMDTRVGRIAAALEQLGLQRQTLVLFVGDNGTPKQSILRAEGKRMVRVPVVSTVAGLAIPGGKGNLTDDGTHVPLIASWPETVPPGQVVNDLVDLSDFLPTLAELAGGTLPADVRIDGHSFVPRLTGSGRSPRRWAFCEQRDRRWVRTQQWKLYDNGQLFDMVHDPDEKQDVTDQPLDPAAAVARKELHQAMESLSP